MKDYGDESMFNHKLDDLLVRGKRLTGNLKAAEKKIKK